MRKSLDIALIWFTCTTTFSLPFFLYGGSFPLAFFEAGSALTNVGVTFLAEGDPLYLYRAFLSLFGGCLFLLTLPHLISTSDSFKFAIYENFPTKKAIYLYFFLFLLGAILYFFATDNLYDSIILSSLTVSTTGGIYLKDELIHIAIFFMFLTSILPIFYAIMSSELKINEIFNRKILNFKNIKLLLKREQLELFFALFFFGFFILFIDNFPLDMASFYLLSFISTTGFVSENFFYYESNAIFILYILAIIGGFIGSVGGGIKLFRIIVLLKLVKSELKRILHPRIITVIKLNNRPIPSEIIEKVLTYFFLYLSGIFATSLLVSFFNLPYRHAAAISISLFTGLGVLPETFKMEIFSNEFLQIFLVFVFLVARLKIFILFIIIQKFYAGVRHWKKS